MGRVYLALLVAAAAVAIPLTVTPATATGSETNRAPQIEVDGADIRVRGLDPAALEAVAARPPELDTWHRVLRVVAVDGERTAISAAEEIAVLPSVLGTYHITRGELEFHPRFPPAPGLVIVVRFDGTAWDTAAGRPPTTSDAVARWPVPAAAAGPPTRVTGIVPSGEVPANLLRFYIYFSAPMSANRVLPHVHLLDADGEPVPLAFVEVPGGLWDPRRTRLTLFVHPGRIKRGVGPRQVLGPVLVAGQRYRLRVGEYARDAAGRPLAEPFETPIIVGSDDHTSPDPNRWRLEPPASPDAPLTVFLDDPADHALLGRLPWIEGGDGKPLAGHLEAAADGRILTFTPAALWEPGTYRLMVPTSLEDPAGNRVDRLFEEMPGHPDDQAPAGTVVERELVVDF